MAQGALIVTRPGAAGEALAAALRAQGRFVWWWPAFDLLPAAEPQAVKQRLQGLAQFGLAVFVSPNAVRFTADLLDFEWPNGTSIGAVGSTTAAAAIQHIAGAQRAVIVAPRSGETQAGSEGFWEAWKASGRHAERVLLLRAEQGRDWLAEQFEKDGAVVESVAVYRRLVHALAPDQLNAARAAMEAGDVPRLVVTSSEAVDAIVEQVASLAGADAWLRSAPVFAIHPRIATALHTAGFSEVHEVAPSDEALIAKLQSALP